tara:strand:- start:8 stop:835 length:828 start_codon:yes stop_codon:yes gene_type:complete
MHLIFFHSLILLSISTTANAEKRLYKEVQIPAYPYVSYSEGAAYAPASVDISELSFISKFALNCAGDSNNNPECSLADVNLTLSLLFFHEPDDCASRLNGCDWVPLGLGSHGKPSNPAHATANDENYYYCCTEEAIMEGVCEREDIYKPMFNENFEKNHGVHIDVLVDIKDKIPTRVNGEQANIVLPSTGYYVFAMMNCNEYLAGLVASGTVVWESENGYLPGPMVGLLGLFFALLFVHLIILITWTKAMHDNFQFLIKIQYCIMLVLTLSFFER